MNKPCPLCGGEAVIRYSNSYQFIECIRCSMVTDYFPTIEAAWAAWNTRPGEDALQAKLESQSEQVQREWASPLEVAQFKAKYAAALEVCQELVAAAIKDQPLKLRYHIEFADGTVYYPANTIDPIADKARKVVEG